MSFLLYLLIQLWKALWGDVISSMAFFSLFIVHICCSGIKWMDTVVYSTTSMNLVSISMSFIIKLVKVWSRLDSAVNCIICSDLCGCWVENRVSFNDYWKHLPLWNTKLREAFIVLQEGWVCADSRNNISINPRNRNWKISIDWK